MSDFTVPSSLPYSKVTHETMRGGGWLVTWKVPPRTPPILGNPIMMTKDGIGTVVIRDGLRCPGDPLAQEFVTAVEIPTAYFAAVAGPRYTIEIHNLNPRGPRVWIYDLAKTCGVALELGSSGVNVALDPKYFATL